MTWLAAIDHSVGSGLRHGLLLRLLLCLLSRMLLLLLAEILLLLQA